MQSSSDTVEQGQFCSAPNKSFDTLSFDLQYPLTDRSPSPPPSSQSSEENGSFTTRPELRVITEPGCYVFPLHPPVISALTSATSESEGSPAFPASPASPLVSSPFSSQSSVPPVVYPPPATEQEVEMHCQRKGTGSSASSTRSRARARPASHPHSPASSSDDLASESPDSAPSSLSARIAPHPYARIYAKRDASASKRRKMWNHLLEKSLFTPDELASTGAPSRRPIYVASLEAHIDQLHTRLLELGLFPVSLESLDEYAGLNRKTVKSMICGLYKDAAEERTKLLELKRANNTLREKLARARAGKPVMMRRHSMDGANYAYPNLFNGQTPSTIIS